MTSDKPDRAKPGRPSKREVEARGKLIGFRVTEAEAAADRAEAAQPAAAASAEAADAAAASAEALVGEANLDAAVADYLTAKPPLTVTDNGDGTLTVEERRVGMEARRAEMREKRMERRAPAASPSTPASE